jgi:hypothetical protein
VLLTACLAGLLLAGPAAAQEPAGGGLRVQRTWRLLAVGLGAGPSLRAERVLRAAERGLRRELPGLDVRFDVDRWRDVPAPSRGEALTDDELVAFAVREAEAAGLEPADYDVVFVFSPLYREAFFGHAHIRAVDRRGRPVRAARIHTAPGRLLVDGALRSLGGGPRGLERSLRALRPGLVAALDHGLARELALLPTIAHELGHFFAPGDLDVRDGYQAPWTRHATGPDDNPDRHGVECVMFKGRDPAFFARKLLATRGRLIRFCDGCRERLGCRRR